MTTQQLLQIYLIGMGVCVIPILLCFAVDIAKAKWVSLLYVAGLTIAWPVLAVIVVAYLVSKRRKAK